MEMSPLQRAKNIAIVFTLTFSLTITACIINPSPIAHVHEDLQVLVHSINAPAKAHPEIATLVKYIKSRNSKLPVEVATLEAITIVETAVAQALPIELLVGIAETETLPPFNPLSESSVGASGLMQIYQAPNITISQEQRFDIKYNLQTGCQILKGKLKTHKGNMSKALTAYSGSANNYSSRVYESIGRYSMYRVTSAPADTVIASN